MTKPTARIRGIRSPIPTGHILGRTDDAHGDAHPIKVTGGLKATNRKMSVALSGDVSVDAQGRATVTGLQGVPVDSTAPTDTYVLTYVDADGQWEAQPATGGGGTGDVVGPASSTDSHVAFFDGTTGKLIKDSGLALSGSNTGDQTLPTGANPTATAGDAAVNGSAATFMRSDGSPAIQKGSSSVFGVVKVDNVTITASGGVISAVAGGSGDVTGPGSAVADHVVFFNGTTGKIIKDSGLALSGSNTGDQTISDATISTTDITTNNVSTSKHGFAPKAPNDATKYLDGTGAYSVPAGGGGGGGMTLLATGTPAAGDTVVSFTSISGAYTNLRLTLLGKSNQTGTGTDKVLLTINNDTSAHYNAQYNSGNNNVVSAPTVGSAANIQIAELPKTGDLAGTACGMQLDILDYTNAVLPKAVVGHYATVTNNSTTGLFTIVVSGWWTGTAAITRLDLTVTGYLAGTKVYLHGY